jgi:hypothetical protein
MGARGNFLAGKKPLLALGPIEIYVLPEISAIQRIDGIQPI